jgi:hypothetical protein
MKRTIEESLGRVGLRTFADMCFMYPMPELAKLQQGRPAEAAVEVRFSGASEGCLRVAVGGGLYDAVASHMMGAPDPAPEQKNDALGEVANIVCGNILPILDGGRSEPRLGSPCPVPLDGRSEGAVTPAAGPVRLNLDRGWAELTLYIDGPGTGKAV